jgi:hypothetical protein
VESKLDNKVVSSMTRIELAGVCVGEFEEVKKSVEEKGVLVRELKAYDYSKSLYLLASKEAVGVSELTDRLNGVVLEKGTNNVVAECVDVLYEDLEVEKLNELLVKGYREKETNDEGEQVYSDDTNEYRVEYAEDGTMIRLYNYNGEWHTATTKCIDARNSYWVTDKYSFDEMFYDAVERDVIQKLDKSLTYCFVLKHPLNRLVIKHEKAEVVFVSKIRNKDGKETLELDLENVGEEELSKVVSRAKVLPEIVEDSYLVTSNWADSMDEETRTMSIQTSTRTNTSWTKEELNNLLKTQDETVKGILFVKLDRETGRYKRVLYESELYKELKEIKGNTPNVEKRWIELYKEDKRAELLKFESVYREYAEKFRDLESRFERVTREIFREYIKTHVYREYRLDETSNYYKSVKRVHGVYMRTKTDDNPKGTPMTQERVSEIVKDFKVHVITKLMGLEQRPNKEKRIQKRSRE